MKLILASYLETPFVDAKNCSEEIKNTLCDSGKAFYKESIIITNQMCSTEAPCMHCAGHFTQPADPPPVCCCFWQCLVLGFTPCPPVGQQCKGTVMTVGDSTATTAQFAGSVPPEIPSWSGTFFCSDSSSFSRV